MLARPLYLAVLAFCVTLLIILVYSNRETLQPVSLTMIQPQDQNSLHQLAWTTVNRLDTLNTSLGPQFLSAYFDRRSSVRGRPAVVVLGYQLKVQPNTTLYCKLTYSSHLTLCQQTPATKFVIVGNTFLRNKQSEPVEYVCHCNGTAQEQRNIPISVAFSLSPNCEHASENIPILNKQPVDNKAIHEFAVCVHSPVFKASSVKIAEFIEMQLALGAHHVTMYFMDVPENFQLVLREYLENDQLVAVKWKPVELHYYGQMLVIHDCLYRNMNRAKYLAFIDLDELILPMQHDNWTGMMKKIDSSPKMGAFVFLNTFFTDSETIGNSMNPCKMLDTPVYFRWTKRYLCKYRIHRRSKFIVKTSIPITEVGIHGVTSANMGGHSEMTVPSTIGINAHYRYRKSSDCTKDKTVMDTTALKYQSQVMKSLKQKICSYN